MAKVEFKNVDKIYENSKTKTIDNLNLVIEDKEFLVLVGPSGCGKSTILRMIAGLESISTGELCIGDDIVNDIHPKDRDIAMVFQNYALYPHMTIKENMAFGLKMRKFSKDEIEKRVLEAAKILNLEEYLDRKPKQLSGGQRQRVALGRAMVREPKVFLMDEPLSNLDAKLRVQMRSEIKKLHKKIGTTFVYVTHDQVEALTMGDRIVILNKGYIQQIGTPQEVYSNPDNIFTAGFVGSPAMNFFNAKVLSENEIEIYNQKISTLNILRFCLRTLTCDIVPGKIIIRVKRNQYVPGLDRVRATSILRLITFGNINIKGYSIFADILTDIAENINEYVKEFIGDFGYGGQIL